ncbi:MAG: PIN domain-containing protein [Thermoplasmata archaeon]
MVSLETTFLVDLRRGDPAAVAKARELEAAGETKCVTPPVAAELFLGAYRFGTEHVVRTQSLLASLVWLDMDREACEEAGRMGAELLARGEAIGAADLFIAATSKRHGHRLLTRDRAFPRVPGLTVEAY